jgi:hypothetical protein
MGTTFGASFSILAFNAMCARRFSNGIGEDAVATGANPNRK